MTPPPHQSIEARAAEEVARIARARLPRALAVLVVTLSIIAVVEIASYPERLAALLIIFPGTMFLMALGTIAVRHPSTPPRRVVSITIFCLVFLILSMTVYFIVVGGNVELLALALVYAVVGSMIALPWGAVPQSVVVAAAIVAYCAATIFGLPSATPRAIPFIGMISMAMLTVASARNLALYHMGLMRRDDEKDALLEIAHDLTGNIDIDEVLSRVQRLTAQLFSCDIVVTYFFDRATNTFRLRSEHGIPEEQREMARAIKVPAGATVFDDKPLWQTRTLAVNDPGMYPTLYPELLASFGVEALLVAPLFVRDKTLGLFVGVSRVPGGFSEVQVDLFDGVARQLSVAIEAAEQYRRQQEEAEVATALARVGRELISALDTPVLLERLCHISANVLHADTTHAFLRDEATGDFVISAGHGDTSERWDLLRGLHVSAAVVESHTGGFADTDVAHVGSPAPDPRRPPVPSEYGTAAGLCSVLRRGDEVVGLLTAGRHDLRPFSANEARLAGGLAQLASLALENARLVEVLDDANRVQGDFVANISHELRTPLNVIIGYNDLLAEEAFGALAEEQSDIVERMGKRARELLELVNITLDLSRIEAGDVPLARRELQVDNLLRDLDMETHLMRLKPQVEMRWEAAVGLPPIYTDPAKLRIVVRNIVVNAIKFTDEGSIRVAAVPIDGGIEISVTDTGIGIPRDMLEAIFQPFRQVDATPGRSGGVGLGLHLVRRLLDMLGGRIVVESDLGHGSIFRIWMPMSSGPENGELADERE